MTDKKEHILRTALELFAKDGLAVPTAKIASASGVANGTLFNYFPTKQALIDTLYLEIKKEVASIFLSGGVVSATSLHQHSFLVWNGYVRWAVAYPLKHKVMNLLKAAHVLTPAAIAQAEDSFKPMYQFVQSAMQQGELRAIRLDYLYEIKTAQIDVSIAQALKHELKGKSLETHIQLGFDIFWAGVEA